MSDDHDANDPEDDGPSMFGDLPVVPAPGSAAASKGAYQVLARKYRPSTFDDLIGQEPMVRTLTNAFKSGRIAQAWMLTGVRGVGKTTTARILSRALNYQIDGEVDEPTIQMQGLGVHCQSIMEGRHPDVLEMDAASHTGINDIREIIEQVRYRPTSARYKVYLIDEVHMLSNQAFNGLLKTLEEPPEHVKFIFATTEIRKVPVTVLSRCQRFDLRRIEAHKMIEHLKAILQKEELSAEDEALTLIARAGEGSVRDCLSLMDQAIATSGGAIEAEAVRAMLGLADRSRIVDLFEKVMEGDIAAALALLDELYAVGAEPAVVLSDLASFSHYVTRLKLAPSAKLDATASELERTRGGAFAETLTIRSLSRAWQMLTKGIDEVRIAPDPLPSAEMVLIRLAYAADLPTPDEALKRLREGGGATGGLSSDRRPSASTEPPSRPSGSSAVDERASTRANASRTDIGSEPVAATHSERDLSPTERERQSSGGVGRPSLRTVSGGLSSIEPAPSSQPQSVPRHQPQPDVVRITSLHDLVHLAEENGNIQVKYEVEHYLRPISFDSARIEVEPTPDAPADLIPKLTKLLKEWTNTRWVVVVGTDGGATLAEDQVMARERLADDARAHPAVAAILNTFPGAEIVDVRVPANEAVEVDAAANHINTPESDLSDEDLDLL